MGQNQVLNTFRSRFLSMTNHRKEVQSNINSELITQLNR